MAGKGAALREPHRWMVLLAAIWLGGLLCVAGIATPAGFAVLGPADGGRVAGRILASEAAISLVFGALILVAHRLRAKRAADIGDAVRFDAALGLTLGAIFCTVAGYYGVQPLMAEARSGRGTLSFGQLHGISVAFFAIKVVLVGWLATSTVFSLGRPS
jgi:Domain of unknown function (DUF4149)